MWKIEKNELRFDFLTAIMVFFIWLRLLFYFKITKTFGPMFKIIQEMIIDLGKFMSIWFVVMLTFTSISILCFGQLSKFTTYKSAFIYFFEVALGQWDFSNFKGNDLNG